MAEHGDLAVAGTSRASRAGERRPGRDARRGSNEMVVALYTDHGSGLRRFAAGLTGDRGRAEDIVQETMLRAWRHPEAVDGQRGDPQARLYTVTRRVAIDQHRARQARPAEVASPATLAARTAPDQIDAAITQWDLAASLDGLPARHRDLLAARYLRGHSIAEIAAALHIPAGTVKSRLAAARGVLRRRLQTGNGFRARQEPVTGGRAW
jgi:RNA polymerase sigma-70 factor, ECF subfamily